MMTRNIRKVVSIVCAVAILMSLCVVSMVGTTSAFKATDTPIGSELKLDFENKTGVSDGTYFSATGTQNTYVADPADPDNTVVQLYGSTMAGVNIEIGNADADTLDGSEAYVLKPNTEYVITFKYKFGEGSYYSADKMLMQLHTGTQSAYSSSALKTLMKSETYEVDATVNTETVVVGPLEAGGANQTVHVLAADTEWMTFTMTFTTGATVAKDNLYINMPVNPQFAPYGKMTGYIDDVTIDIVDEEEEVILEDLNNTTVINFREDATNTYWAPNNHSYFSNSDTSRGSKSYVDAEGAHLTVTNQNGSTTTPNWRHKVFAYDQDNGGFFQLKSDASYIVTVKYKLLTKGSNSAAIGIGYTTDTNASATSTTRPDQAKGQMHMLAGIKWKIHQSVTADWQYLTASFEATDALADTWLAVLAHGDNASANEFLIESITIREVRNVEKDEAVVNFETNGGDAIASDILVAGTASSALPTPTHSDENKGFAGWYTDAEFTTPVGETIATGTHTFYAKWTSEFVNITYNNSGELSTVKLANGAALSNPVRPNSKMFFEGWYTDLAFTNKVTVAPDNDCTLYAKYNYTFIGFNNGGYTAKTISKTGITTDPDDADNKVLELHTIKGSSNNFELGNYDDAAATVYEMPKTNTTYYIEFKVKVPAGNTAGRLTLYTGEQSLYSVDCSKSTVSGFNYDWTAAQGENGTDWVTFSGYYTVGDTFYRERVNFSVQDQFYFVYTGIVDGKLNASAGSILIDDVIVGEYSEEVPAGAVGIYFETNSDKVTPMFGYTGEAITMPEDPVLGGHEFIGWYTDMSFVNEFDATTFGDETITLYAKWKSVPQTYDYTNFVSTMTSDRYNHVVEGDNAYLRYNYEQGTSSSAASAIARSAINDGNIYKVTDGATYTMKFRYNVEETTGTVNIKTVTHEGWNGWTETTDQSGTLSVAAATDGWVDGEITFTAKCRTANATSLSLGVGGDATVLIDDITLICTGSSANIYGSTVIRFDGNGGPEVDPVSGNPGDAIVLPSPVRDGFKFAGWYTESGLINKYTEKTYGEEDVTLYAAWVLGKFAESFEEFPTSAEMGIASAYELYSSTNTDVVGFDKANVQSGSTSIFRDGTKTGTKGFTLCRDTGLTLGIGEQYTVTFYVKPANVTDAAGTINLLQMSSNTAVSVPDSTETITDVGSLVAGEWQKVSYTFTATEQYIGIATSEGNDIYFDNFTVTLKGYTGRPTGDSTVSPIVVMMMVVLAAGAMVVTGKKVFAK